MSKRLTILVGSLMLLWSLSSCNNTPPATVTVSLPNQATKTTLMLTPAPLFTGTEATSPQNCQASPLTNVDLGEVKGTATTGELWGLIFSTLPLHTRQLIKIAWHMTGTGDFKIRAELPAGPTIQPDWGPELHEGSSWSRPGAEWGTGFTFPQPGCWQIITTRGNNTGEVRFFIESS